MEHGMVVRFNHLLTEAETIQHLEAEIARLTGDLQSIKVSASYRRSLSLHARLRDHAQAEQWYRLLLEEISKDQPIGPVRARRKVNPLAGWSSARR